MPHSRLLTAAGLGVGLVLLAAGCGGASAGSGVQDGKMTPSILPETVPSEVLGVLNGEEITLADLSERDRWQLARLRADYYTEAHRLLEESAIRTARERLLLSAATEKGLTLNLYYSQEIGIPEVSDAELQRVYNQNRQQFGGRTLAEIGSDLRRQIANQKLNMEIEQAGNELLRGAEWDLTVPAYRISIETEGHAALGPDEAGVEMVVFSDFECPYCRRFNLSLDQLREEEEYSEQVRVVFRHYPLRSIHPLAQKAAEASVCAEEQGKFWEYHDALWTDDDLGSDVLEHHARLLGLDTEEFAACVNSGRNYARVQTDVEAAMELGQSGTPAVFLNGRHIGGYLTFDALKAQIDRELAESSN